MTIDEVIQVLNANLPNPLSGVQDLILREAWQGKTYTAIAQQAYYGNERIRKIAAQLWVLLSEMWDEPINKANFRTVLEARSLTLTQQQLIWRRLESDGIPTLEYPDRPLFAASRLYISRPPIEELAYTEILKPGSLIRIKAPRKMGKTSLILQLLDRVTTENYVSVTIDFQQADNAIFSSLDKFLRWFSANLSRELQLPSQLDDYWDEDIGSKVSCTIYLQGYVLAQLQQPIVLVLTELDRVFEFPEIAAEFLPLLRFWHEQARKVEIWQKLRLIITYSTEVYVPLNLNQSPFNVGLPLSLPRFNHAQVQTLAKRYGLNWLSEAEIEQLMEMVCGHPYLIQLAFYHLAFTQQNPTLNLAEEETLEQKHAYFQQLLEQAPTASGIYNDYLRRQLNAVQDEPQLLAAIKKVIVSKEGITLEPVLTYQLSRLGLVELDGDHVLPCCKLCRLYLTKQLLLDDTINLSQKINLIPDSDSRNFGLANQEQLHRENLKLQQLCNLDELTNLSNRRYFESYFKLEWQRAHRERINLSLILCDIDYFKIYNAIYGYATGDECLQKIARSIQECVNRTDDLVARYGGEEFVILLPRTDLNGASCVAERIRAQIKSLAIPIKSLQFGGFPEEYVTVSLGVGSLIPQSNTTFQSLMQAAEQALYQSKRKGRNRVTISPLKASRAS